LPIASFHIKLFFFLNIDCATCNTIISIYFTYIHSNLGFLPFSSPVYNKFSFDQSISINSSNIISYVSLHKIYTGSRNFISKIVPVDSHININLLGELSQGFYDPQVLDLIQYGLPLDLDK
jgi:hypothetical protein